MEGFSPVAARTTLRHRFVFLILVVMTKACTHYRHDVMFRKEHSAVKNSHRASAENAIRMTGQERSPFGEI